jgi:uncharacterized protein YggT (Ycf19 family)
MIELFFTLLSILILARVIFSFIGYNYGGIYDFVFMWSEKVLIPIRKRIPVSAIDWSPLIALIIFDFMGKFLPLFITAAAGGEFRAAFYVLYYAIISTISSLTSLFIIIFVVKFFNGLTGGGNYMLTRFIDSATDPLIKKVRNSLPSGYKRYSFWVSAALLVVLQLILKNQLRQF